MGGGRVIFSLTETQAAALGAIALGARVDPQSLVIRALVKKDWVMIAASGGAISLTDLGRAAAKLATELQARKLNGGAR